MKRDLDIQRELLIRVEGAEDIDGLAFTPEALFTQSGWPEGYLESGQKMNEVEEYNIKKLQEAGFVTAEYLGEFWHVNLTHDGHDYLDAVRNDTVWKKTKAGAAKVGGMSLDMIKDLAIAYGKQIAADKLGITL